MAVVVVTGTVTATGPARAPARPRAPGPRRRRLRFPPARTMKWMFKEDHALGKGGPGPGAALPAAPGPRRAARLSPGGQPPAAPAEGWRGARDGLAERPETPGGGERRSRSLRTLPPLPGTLAILTVQRLITSFVHRAQMRRVGKNPSQVP